MDRVTDVTSRPLQPSRLALLRILPVFIVRTELLARSPADCRGSWLSFTSIRLVSTVDKNFAEKAAPRFCSYRNKPRKFLTEVGHFWRRPNVISWLRFTSVWCFSLMKLYYLCIWIWIWNYLWIDLLRVSTLDPPLEWPLKLPLSIQRTRVELELFFPYKLQRQICTLLVRRLLVFTSCSPRSLCGYFVFYILMFPIFFDIDLTVAGVRSVYSLPFRPLQEPCAPASAGACTW